MESLTYKLGISNLFQKKKQRTDISIFKIQFSKKFLQNSTQNISSYEKAGTFSSKDGVQQEDEAEQDHSQLHVLQCLQTTLHQFSDIVVWDRKQVRTCSPSTPEQTDGTDACVLIWWDSFVCTSTDIDPALAILIGHSLSVIIIKLWLLIYALSVPVAFNLIPSYRPYNTHYNFYFMP